MDKLEIEDRVVEVRESNPIYKYFTLEEIHVMFKKTIFEIEEIILSIDEDSKTIQDENILRYQIVRVESAFDYLIHLLIKLAFVKMFNNEISATDGYKKFMVSLDEAKELIDNPGENWILKVTDNKISSMTFLAINDLSKWLNCIKPNLLKEIAIEIYKKDSSTSYNELKKELNFVYSRRNEISHQMDCEHISGAKFSIDKIVVSKCVKIIDTVVENIIFRLKAEYNL